MRRSLKRYSVPFGVACALIFIHGVGCAHPQVNSQVSSSPDGLSHEVQVPFAISKRTEPLEKLPQDFWNSRFRFVMERASATNLSIEHSTLVGKVISHLKSSRVVNLEFYVVSAERSEKLPNAHARSVVSKEQSMLIFKNMPMQLTYHLDTKIVSSVKGFAEIQKKIEQNFKGEAAADFLSSVLNSFQEDPFAYFNFAAFSFEEMESHRPLEKWSLKSGQNLFGNLEIERSFVGWTEGEEGNFAIFTSNSKASPADLSAVSEPNDPISASFGMNEWLLIRQDWKERKSRIEIRQSMSDASTHQEMNGTSSIDLAISPL